jgi:hypothetical protein
MPGRSLLVVALLVGALATGLASVSFAQSSTTRTDDRGARSDRPARPPSQLWGRFPLGKSTVERTSTRTLRSPSPPAAAIANDDSNSGERLMLVVGLLALGMLVPALGALVLLKTRQRRLVAQSREGLLAIIAEARPPEQRLVEIQTFTATLGCDKVSVERPRARGEQVKEESQAKSPQQEGPVASRDYTQLGDRVAAVLQAAEEAAEQMRGEAQTAAEQMTREAKQESSSLLESAKSEAQRVRVEADREAKNTREAVESYATNHRRDAEEKAAKMLSEAEAQARASREAAEAMARQIEERAATLGEEVREQERMIRGRMQRYLAALRDVSGQIEEVIGETERGEPTLVEALEPERQHAKQESG